MRVNGEIPCEKTDKIANVIAERDAVYWSISLSIDTTAYIKYGGRSLIFLVSQMYGNSQKEIAHMCLIKIGDVNYYNSCPSILSIFLTVLY